MIIVNYYNVDIYYYCSFDVTKCTFHTYRDSDPLPKMSSLPKHRHYLYNLYDRQLSRDPFPRLPLFQRNLYSCKSFVQRLRLEKQLEGHQGCVNCINFSFSGQLLASGSDDLHLILWDWARGKVVGKYDTGHVANVFQVGPCELHLCNSPGGVNVSLIVYACVNVHSAVDCAAQ